MNRIDATARRRLVARLCLAVALAARLGVAPFTEDPWDLEVWRNTGSRVLAGQTPYAAVALPYAYPLPWAGWCALATAATGPAHPRAWRLALKLPLVIADGLLAVLLMGLGPAGIPAALVVAGGLPFWAVSALWGQFDALPALLTAFALLGLARGRPGWAGVLLGTASWWKLLYPALALPWLCACSWRRHGPSGALRFGGGWAAALGLGVGPALVWDVHGFSRVLAFQSERGPQGLTLWPLVARALPPSMTSWAAVGDVLMPLALVSANALLIWHRRRSGPPSLAESAAGTALLSLVFLVTAKVVNEQYVLWLASPLLVAWAASGSRRLGALAALSLSVTSVYLLLHLGPDLIGFAPGWWRGESFPLYWWLDRIALGAWIAHLGVLLALLPWKTQPLRPPAGVWNEGR